MTDLRYYGLSDVLQIIAADNGMDAFGTEH